MPERILSWISSRSNSAIPARRVAIMRPCGVVRANAMPFSATSDTRRASSSLSVASRSIVLAPSATVPSPTPRRSRAAAQAPAPCDARHDRVSPLTRFPCRCRSPGSRPVRQRRRDRVPAARRTGRWSRPGSRSRRAVALAVPVGLFRPDGPQAPVPVWVPAVAVRLHPDWDGRSVPCPCRQPYNPARSMGLGHFW